MIENEDLKDLELLKETRGEEIVSFDEYLESNKDVFIRDKYE